MAKLHSITCHGAHVIKINQAFLLLSRVFGPHPYCIKEKPGTEAKILLLLVAIVMRGCGVSCHRAGLKAAAVSVQSVTVLYCCL